MKLRWNTLGAKLGLLFCVAGLVAIWAGWNGAASYDQIEAQFPYLISGGLAGLALVVIGVGVMVIQSQRADRAQVEAHLQELKEILERASGVWRTNGAEPAEGSSVLAGPNAYHRPGCRLVVGRELPRMSVGQAEDSGLEPCRTCAPPAAAEVDLAGAPSSASPGPASGTRGR